MGKRSRKARNRCAALKQKKPKKDKRRGWRDREIAVKRAAEDKAIEMYRSGDHLHFSTGMAGFITFGFGKEDRFGEFEFPLPYTSLSKEHKKAVDTLEPW